MLKKSIELYFDDTESSGNVDRIVQAIESLYAAPSDEVRVLVQVLTPAAATWFPIKAVRLEVHSYEPIIKPTKLTLAAAYNDELFPNAKRV